MPDYEKAATYAFLICSSFSSVYPRGGGFSGYNKKTDKMKLEILINKLEKNIYTDRINSITKFHSSDFEEIIKKYDSPKTLIYLDPPYARVDINGNDDAKRLFWYGCDSENTFGPASHRRLLELLKTTESKWILSYYYFPLLEEILPRDKYIWEEKEFHRSSATVSKNNAKGKELLILNYDPTTGIKI
jgi:DNA adenine methylase